MVERPRIAVIGTVVQDRVERADGSTATGLGGIAYSVGAVAALGGDDVEIVPVCRVADDVREAVSLEWSRWLNVSQEALLGWEGPASRVELRYVEGGLVGGDRDERLLGLTPPLEAGEVDAVFECDAVLVNCITGPVLAPCARRALSALPAPIHLDVHSLVLGIDETGLRFPERPPDWFEWLLAVDSVQCNEHEAAVLAGETGWNLSTDRFVTGLVDAADGPRTMIVTHGAGGATLYRRGIAPLRVRAPEIEVVDPTGAGDAFGAAFVLAVTSGITTEAAVRHAVSVASASCALEGTRGLGRLREVSAGIRA